MQSTDNTILITGGTSGIGRALAEAFHQRGNQVVIAGRRQSLLDEITAHNEGMRGILLDLEDPASLAALIKQVPEQFPHLNVLINNAGISVPQDLTNGDTDISVSKSMISTNIFATLELTAALLPLLREQASATIMATTSGLAFVPSARFPTYCATKAFLHSWLQSLRFQLRDTSVEVLELVPPYVQTELAGAKQASDPNAMPLADYVAEVMRFFDVPEGASNEILVERVKKLRFAAESGQYEQVYQGYNNR